MGFERVAGRSLSTFSPTAALTTLSRLQTSCKWKLNVAEPETAQEAHAEPNWSYGIQPSPLFQSHVS